MDVIREYYLRKYDELSILSDTKKCKTTLMRNRDTGETVVKKVMNQNASDVYNQLKNINHKNLVNILECFDDGENCVAIEEYINGRRLDDYCKEQSVTLYDCIRLSMDICNGLEAIHEKGIIHRDIQPKNIIVSNEGTLKLIDFDISRIENEESDKDTELLGTVGYAAPEQYGFSQTSNRSDIYSVGVVLRDICKSYEETSTGDSAKLQQIKPIINKCMEMDPKNRYKNVTELRKALETAIKSSDNEELPKITLQYVIGTIPGLKSKNTVCVIGSVFVYGILLIGFGGVAFDVGEINIYRKILGAILSVAAFIIPYTYLTNIADIVFRFPKMNFVNKTNQYIYQIVMAFGLFVFFALCVGLVLPLS